MTQPLLVPYFDYGMPKEKIKHGRKGDAGYDTYNASKHSIVIEPHQTVKIPLGFGLKLPEGRALFQSARSGHATRGISIGFIPVDSNYTGEISAITTNTSDETIIIEPQERFGQFVVLDVEDSLVFEDADPKDYQTERGDKGFNSSGRF